MIESIQKAADADERVQLALSGVWLDEDDGEIYSNWFALMKRYGFIGEDPRVAL